MADLSKGFIQFYKDLAANNNRDWFHENKKRYEQTVKKPFQVFVTALIDAFKEIEPTTEMTAKQAIFRINRDIRFSKDKTPYKLHASAAISTTNKKDYANSKGIYIEINPDFIRQYGGLYGLNKEQLQNVREGINKNMKRFQNLVTDNQFVETFDELRGEQNKRIPKAFKPAHAKQPLIANKQFYYYKEISIDQIDSDDLIKSLIENYKKALPLNEFFDEVLNG